MTKNLCKLPKPLKKGDIVAIPAPSSGLELKFFPRLEVVKKHLESFGFIVVEGKCLRKQDKQQSSSKEERAKELMEFLLDPNIAAVYPPWGGERAIEILELMDFEKLKNAQAKWFLGFSDISTLHFPLTTLANWVTVHTIGSMDIVPLQLDSLSRQVVNIMQHNFNDAAFLQECSDKFQVVRDDYALKPECSFNLTEKTIWQRLDKPNEAITLEGVIVGGCIDTISRLAGSIYGDFPKFVRTYAELNKKVILYIENCELVPCEVLRTLYLMKFNSWFVNLEGVILGRNSAVDPINAKDLTYFEAIQDFFSSFNFPVLYDLDIGHRPPQISILNGTFAKIFYDGNGKGIIEQGFWK